VNRIVQPGATLGVLGSGQLGRMFTLAARQMGYRVHTLSPGADTPTGQVADLEVDADYDDLDAVRAFARGVDVITFEFENVPTEAADAAAAIVPVRPTGHALHVTQQRAREKGYLALKGFPVTPFEPVATLEELTAAVGRVGLPAILKTASFGYDGKGQHRLSPTTDLAQVWELVGHQPAILERVVDFRLEFSIVAARGLDGAFAHYDAFENTHRDHILDVSVAPARMSARAEADAVAVTRAIMDDLHYVGVLCVEFFLTDDDRVLVNEIAPRPHNSGHLTIDAYATSQFESRCARSAVCRWAPRPGCALPPWPISSANSGHAASPCGTSPWHCRT
jgi:5-(carboxyamino)imidazole ribonucleotide synthase